MSHQKQFIRAVAEILLLGDWNASSMGERISWLINEQPLWVNALVNHIYQKFRPSKIQNNQQLLVDFISDDTFFYTIWSQNYQHIKIRNYNLKPLPLTEPVLNCDIPVLTDIKQLSNWLGLKPGQLQSYANNWHHHSLAVDHPYRHYHYHWMTQTQNRKRLIEAPKSRLSAAQRQIYLGILDKIPLHHHCHGFRKRHSCLSYVQPHTGKKVVVHMDLKNFFMSIALPRIQALFAFIGYSPTVARNLAGICCHQTPMAVLDGNSALSWQQRKQLLIPHLTQGSPSSPALANLCAYQLDARLTGLVQEMGAQYTRYADDLAFSGNEAFARVASRLPVWVSYISSDEGFSINHRKTRIMGQGGRQCLTGITLNCFPNSSRQDFDSLKAILYNCVKYGPDSQNRRQHPHFRAHLQGRISHMGSLNKARGQKLKLLFNQIMW